jgi:hypothetical protein
MPQTISAADHLRRSACPPDTYRRAGDLLMALAAVECHVSAGGPAQVPPALLRDLVLITAGLVGRTWLDANADRLGADGDGAAVFTAAYATQHPPLPELDRILARVLSDRFSLASAAGPAPLAGSGAGSDAR